MKVLRIIHGLANNVMDVQVADNFNLGLWAKEMRADEGVVIGDYFINRQWVQHAALISEENASKLHSQGMTKQ